MKTAVITGISKGIGLATAKKFLDEGWRVIGTNLKTPVPIENPNLITIKYDQSSPESIRETAEEIKKAVLRVDVLVNNAAILLDAHDSSIDIEKLRKTFETDLFGLIDFTERLVPHISHGGHVININSQYGSLSFPIDDTQAISYRLAKTALNQYTRILAFQLESRGIIVSSLDPGWVKTKMGLSVADETEGPDRDPSEPANDIFEIVKNVNQTGQFWRFGEKREW